jgi:hypothetical protein
MLLLFVVLTPFVGFGELKRVLGESKLKQLLLRPRSLKNHSTSETA